MNAKLILALTLGVGTLAAHAAPPPTATAPAKRAEVLPFIEDDYARALSTAKSRQLPIFVDAWAPW